MSYHWIFWQNIWQSIWQHYCHTTELLLACILEQVIWFFSILLHVAKKGRHMVKKHCWTVSRHYNFKITTVMVTSTFIYLKVFPIGNWFLNQFCWSYSWFGIFFLYLETWKVQLFQIVWFNFASKDVDKRTRETTGIAGYRRTTLSQWFKPLIWLKESSIINFCSKSHLPCHLLKLHLYPDTQWSNSEMKI